MPCSHAMAGRRPERGFEPRASGSVHTRLFTFQAFYIMTHFCLPLDSINFTSKPAPASLKRPQASTATIRKTRLEPIKKELKRNKTQSSNNSYR